MQSKDSTDLKLKRLGKKVRGLRQKKKLSQEALSKITGLHRNYISDVENGGRNLSFESLLKLSSGLEVKLHDLVKNL